MAIERKLSELEGCVLGILWANGPCTAYFIRTIFLESLSPYWSGSAGAIYPLVERLERRAFIRSTEGATGRRRSKRYALTAVGRRQLDHWLKPLPDLVVGVPPDPLRTRLEFLEALPEAQRIAFIQDAKRRLKVLLRAMVKHCEGERRSGREYAYLAALGTLKMMRARIAWLNQVAGHLQERKDTR